MSGPKKGRQALVEKFQALTRERLERLNGAMLALERDPADSAAATALMREIHTLKGEAKLMGFADINLVAHRTEDLLIRALDQGFRFDAEVPDFVLKAFDLIGELLGKAAGTGEPQVDLTVFARQVDRLLNLAAPAPAREVRPGTIPAPPQAPAPSPTRQVPAVKREVPADIPAEQLLRIDVEQVEELTRYVGDLLQFQAETARFVVVLADLIDEWRRQLYDLRHRLTIGSARQGSARASMVAGDYLYDVVTRLIDTGTRAAHSSDRARDVVSAAGESLGQLEQTVRDLRLVPILSLFSRYTRAVRDLSKEQRKKVNIAIRGGDLRLDKYVIDRIGEPLLHLIRNSVDHGIETPDARRAVGKPEEGSIVLSAAQVGSRVEIMVSDDGRGISADLIRSSAIAKRIVSPAEAGEMTPEQLLQFVFRPNFSTRDEATDVSGRGMGLDIVKGVVESLGGAVHVESRLGHETRFVASVPVFAALSRALLVGVQGVKVALPSAAVVAITDLGMGTIVHAGSGIALQYGEGIVPLRALSSLLGAARWSEAAEEMPQRVVIVEGEGRRLGLLVSAVHSEQEVLQRPLGAFLDGARLMIGAMVLEEGQPAMILNVPELIRRAGMIGRHHASGEVARASRRVLLVDDSELFREMVAGIVRTMGHEVAEAANGRQGLERMHQRIPDLVITDLEMPLMDGFELIAAVRSTPTLRDIPIIVLSGLGAERDKVRAAALGAEAYLVKTEFREQDLRRSIDRFLQAHGAWTR